MNAKWYPYSLWMVGIHAGMSLTKYIGVGSSGETMAHVLIWSRNQVAGRRKYRVIPWVNEE